MTKRSKVYLGLVTTVSVCARSSPKGMGSVLAALSSRTRKATRSSAPYSSLAADRRNARKCSSIHSRVKSLGTTTVKTPSPTPPASACPNQVWKVVSLRVSLSLPETPCQRRCPLLSVVASPPLTAPSTTPQHGGQTRQE